MDPSKQTQQGGGEDVLDKGEHFDIFALALNCNLPTVIARFPNLSRLPLVSHAPGENLSSLVPSQILSFSISHSPHSSTLVTDVHLCNLLMGLCAPYRSRQS